VPQKYRPTAAAAAAASLLRCTREDVLALIDYKLSTTARFDLYCSYVLVSCPAAQRINPAIQTAEN